VIPAHGRADNQATRSKARSAKRRKLAGLVVAAGLIAASAMPAIGVVGAGAAGNTSFTNSTSHHPHSLYYGTLRLTRAGEGAPYSSSDGFEVEIRFSAVGANQTASQLGNDPRISAGFAGSAPDGGSWLTSDPDPNWWELPNFPNHPQGPGHPEQHVFPQAQQLFNAAIDANSRLAPGESANCSDSVADFVLKQDPSSATADYPFFARTVTTIGPATIMTGEDHKDPFVVPAGTINFDTELSFLVLDVHRRDRTCTVSRSAAPPPGGGGGGATPDPAVTAAQSGPRCLSIAGVVRNRVAKVKGGGKLTLATQQLDDPAAPLRLSVKLSGGGGSIRSVVFTANGKATTASGRTASVPVTDLSIGSRRNKLQAKVTLSSGKTVTLQQLAVVLRCSPPATTCKRVGDGHKLTCNSKTPLGGRRVKVTVVRLPTEKATGSATVSKGKYTVTVSSSTALGPGTYAYKAIVTTKRRGERFQMLRLVTVT
jgi:hypothetical protein